MLDIASKAQEGCARARAAAAAEFEAEAEAGPELAESRTFRASVTTEVRLSQEDKERSLRAKERSRKEKICSSLFERNGREQ